MDVELFALLGSGSLNTEDISMEEVEETILCTQGERVEINGMDQVELFALLGSGSLNTEDIGMEEIEETIWNSACRLDEVGMGKVPEYPVWTSTSVNVWFSKHGYENINLIVMDMVPSWEYHEIVKLAKNVGYTIVNPRPYPYLPRVSWVTVRELCHVQVLRRDHPEEIILIMIDPSVPRLEFLDIVYHAIEKGFIILNSGLWEKPLCICGSDAIAEAQLQFVELQIREERDKRAKIEAAIDRMQSQFMNEILVARSVSEAFGRAQDCAEIESDAETFLKFKTQDISRPRDKLQHFEAKIHEMSPKDQEVKNVETVIESKNGETSQLRDIMQHYEAIVCDMSNKDHDVLIKEAVI